MKIKADQIKEIIRTVDGKTVLVYKYKKREVIAGKKGLKVFKQLMR